MQKTFILSRHKRQTFISTILTMLFPKGMKTDKAFSFCIFLWLDQAYLLL